MKVRYTEKPEITGDASSLNMHGVGEVIVWYTDGSASSEEISLLEVYLDSQQRWMSLSEAFRRNDVITDNHVSRFAEPRSQAERDRGWSD